VFEGVLAEGLVAELLAADAALGVFASRMHAHAGSRQARREADARSTARLWLDDELLAGTADPADLARPEVLAAARVRPIPAPGARLAEEARVRAGTLDAAEVGLLAADRVRRAVLGDAAAGPPRVLVRNDEFPHARAWDEPERFGTEAHAAFHAVLRDAGVPYLVAVVPHVPRDYLDPRATQTREHDDGERAMLTRMRDDGVAFAVHGLDHRTRRAMSQRHGELRAIGRRALEERLDRAEAVLRERGTFDPVLVPPFNRFDTHHWPALSRRFSVVCGGPESVRAMGVHPPQVRDGAVWLPSHPPFYARAADLLPALERAAEREIAAWLPVTLHWGWEVGDDFAALERLAALLAELARPWGDLLAAAQRARGVWSPALDDPAVLARLLSRL
jgi:hypothetical protein